MQNEEAVMSAIDAAFNRKKDQFRPVKDFLYQVKDAKRKVSLIEGRIEYRMDSMGAHGVSYEEHIPSGHDYSGNQKALRFFVILVAVLGDESAAGATPSPAFIVCRLLDRSHSDQREMLPHFQKM